MLSSRLYHIHAFLCRAPHSQPAPHAMFPTVSLLPDPPPQVTSPDPSHQQFTLANTDIAEKVQAKEKLTLLGMMRETGSLLAEELIANTRAQATIVFIYSEPYLISRSLDLQVAGQAVRKFQNEASGLIWVCFSIQ